VTGASVLADALVLAGSEAGKAGPLGLLVIILLGLAVVFLYRSMVRHMKKVPESFDRPPEPDGGKTDAAPPDQ